MILCGYNLKIKTKKMKKILLYFLGAFVAFIFNKVSAAALTAHPVYGTDFTDFVVDIPKPTYVVLFDKVTSIILTPIFAVIAFALAFSVGIFICIKRKRKNKINKDAKKDSKTR